MGDWRNDESIKIFNVIKTAKWLFNFKVMVNMHIDLSQWAAVAQSVSRLATGWTAEGSEFESWYGQELTLLRVVLSNWYQELFKKTSTTKKQT
jgi:hypothetical protein